MAARTAGKDRIRNEEITSPSPYVYPPAQAGPVLRCVSPTTVVMPAVATVAARPTRYGRHSTVFYSPRDHVG